MNYRFCWVFMALTILILAVNQFGQVHLLSFFAGITMGFAIYEWTIQWNLDKHRKP